MSSLCTRDALSYRLSSSCISDKFRRQNSSVPIFNVENRIFKLSVSVKATLKMALFIYFAFVILNLISHVQGYIEYPNKTDESILIIDTDAGVDDAVAILNILGFEELFDQVKVKLITAVHGNTHVDNVGRNVLKILKVANRLDIPVHKGANQSILITPKPEFYFGVDGFGDFEFPDPPSESWIKKEHAVTALINAVTSHPGKITLVCLGPLTNIAMAVRMNPNFLNNIKEIFILGGSDSGVGNIKPGIEFNFYVDPEAAYIVFSEAKKRKKVLNLLTWETAYSRSVVEMQWRKQVLGKINSPQVDLINKAEKLSSNAENWISADTLLSSIVINKNVVVSSKEYHVDVEVCGQYSRAGIFVDYEQNETFIKNIRLIQRINVDLHKKMLLQYLNPRGGQTNGARALF